MQYGHFDDEKQEYVITRPDTPTAWANYLGSPEYGALISNNAGGYSFVKSGADGRIIRYIFNYFDEPGRYIYIRDNESGDYWSASWQPVGKPLDKYKSVCRHGTDYTIIEADYEEIHSEATYYVPLNKTYEVWHTKIKNTSDRPRKLTVTGYCEFTNHNNYEQDLVNMQYSLYVTETKFRGDYIRQTCNGNLYHEGSNEKVNNSCLERFFGLSGAPVSSYCGDKAAFLGAYRKYDRPIGVEKGDLGNVLNFCMNSCGALSTVIELAPGEETEFSYTLGLKGDKEARQIVDHYKDHSDIDAELKELIDYWHGKLAHFHIETPNKEFNTMINTWNAFNCFITFTWSRAASFIYCGMRNGYGYRDTVQDIQGVIHLAPAAAKKQIELMLSGQVDNGGALPLVKYTHNPGHELTPEDKEYGADYRADDALWLFPTVYKYIAESGDIAFLDEVIPFANKDEGTVYEHLKRAIHFSETHSGKHGLPAGLTADWNDCLNLGKQGESVFVAFQFYYAMRLLNEFAEVKGDKAYSSELVDKMADFKAKLNDICYDGDRYVRGLSESGRVIGSRDNEEGSMWLNPQSWAVISGAYDDDKIGPALENVHKLLNTDWGVMLLAPYLKDHALPETGAVCFNPTVKENGGIFSQPQGWIILAESLMGHGNRAFEYYSENCPAMQNDKAEIRCIEPYIYGQFTEGNASPYHGRSHVHWLTGTASTIMVGSVEGILGMRPDINGIKIAPSIPSAWDKMTIDKDFRGKKLHITVLNPDHKESGFSSMTVNGKKFDSSYIPADELADTNEIVLTL